MTYISELAMPFAPGAPKACLRRVNQLVPFSTTVINLLLIPPVIPDPGVQRNHMESMDANSDVIPPHHQTILRFDQTRMLMTTVWLWNYLGGSFE